MKWDQIIKTGIIGGIVAIVLEFIVGLAAHGAAYSFGFVAMLIGGFIAGWMLKRKSEEGVVSGVIAGLFYVILGLFILFPILAKYHSANPGGAVIAGIVLGAVGGFVGCYLACMTDSSKPKTSSRRKK